MIIYREISTHDPEYSQEKELRNRILRMPLGLHLSEQDVRDEDEQVHLSAMDGRGRVIGCVLVAFSGNVAKVRQLAIDDDHQGRGIGTGLMKRAEQAILARNVRTVTLHGRVTARGFFEKLGYTAVSEVFTEVTIPHIAMRKDLGGWIQERAHSPQLASGLASD